MFVYKQWEDFCNKLKSSGFSSVTAEMVLQYDQRKPFIVLKHDVEANPSKALKLAQIESKHSHKGSYYVQAYLLKQEKNIRIFRRIQELGHEVSYHHDVMDSNKGDIKQAALEFHRVLELFREHGFPVNTVCQHGNPVIERSTYTSNRDFFRNAQIAQKYHDISEIMVNYRQNIGMDYEYISDAGYGWKIISDPENNDLIDSSHSNIPIDDLDGVFELVMENKSIVISTHPHRWNQSRVVSIAKGIIFQAIKRGAKSALRVPLLKKFMSRFYYLAKKI